MAESEDEAIYRQADEQCRRPAEASCTCGDIKPYGYGFHICVGNEPAAPPAPGRPVERTRGHEEDERE